MAETEAWLNPDQLRALIEAGYELIPLTAQDDERVDERSRGKKPRDPRWTTRDYSSFDPFKHMKLGGNVGVRLTAEQLVIDVDPRNFGDDHGDVDPFSDLVLNLGLDPTGWPRVETGSGGSHYYLRKPADVDVADSLEDFPGVEFKSRGRQVVAPGSIHPNGSPYLWDPFDDDPSAAPKAPAALLGLIRKSAPAERPETDPGVCSPERLARALEGLDPGDFREYADWIELMMACHHATNGEGRQEFVEWSTGDPPYADDGFRVGRHWDSLHAGRKGGVTHRTLQKTLNEAGRPDLADLVTRADAAEDFDDEAGGASEDAQPTGTVDELVDRMNGRFCAVLEGGKFTVFMEDSDDAFDPPRQVWVRMSRDAFLHYHEDERIRPPGKDQAVSVAKAWLAHPRRRKYPGITMDPRDGHGEKLNLWRGWAIEPEPGDWSLMRGLIEDVLCAGDPAMGVFVLRWIAFMLQRPWESPEVALAFRGSEGTGKGTLGRALMRIAGTHGLTVASPSQFAGRFNAHLRDAVFLFADEAFWPGHKEAEGVLKQLVTEPVISYEAKGRDISPGRNLVHLMMASNNQWVVPAGLDARRFAASDVADDRRGDRDFFARLWAQMERSGLPGMVHDLMAMDLDGWHPSRELPRTGALADQKVMSLEPAMKWWHEKLDRGELPVFDFAEPGWREDAVTLGEAERTALVEDYDSFLKRNRIHHVKATHRALTASGKPLGLKTKQINRNTERAWVLPPLPDMRQRFEARLGADGLFD